MKGSNGCWTCKDRRVQCDEGKPACKNCTRLKKHCQGYGLRLSWPRANDRRRAITASSRPATAWKGAHPFLNTTRWDVELYHSLSQPGATPPYLLRRAPNMWAQPRPGAGNLNLIQYFHHVAYHSLMTFNPDPIDMRNGINSMLLTGTSTSASALHLALMAFSSLRRSGLQKEAMQYKISALNTLSKSAARASLEPVEAAQHVAACMLLCNFEIQLPSDSSGDWLWYVAGALDVIEKSHLNKQHEGIVAELLNWVYYHDSLSRFTRKHWRHLSVVTDYRSPEDNPRAGRPLPPIRTKPIRSESTSPQIAVLDMLGEACEMIVHPKDPRAADPEYKSRLSSLEKRVKEAANLGTVLKPTRCKNTNIELTVELYRMATQIYIVRASSGSASKIHHLVDKASRVPMENPSCQHFFPLFIIACEARGDEHRGLVLRMIERTERDVHARSMKGFRAAIQSVWVQQDLHADENFVVNYMEMMGVVVSSSNTLPSFV